MNKTRRGQWAWHGRLIGKAAILSGLFGAASALARELPPLSVPPLAAAQEPKKAVEPVEPKEVAKSPARIEKKISFEFRDKPWSSVMEWFADQSGLPFIATVKPPTGSFTFINPKDEGKSREYTLAQVVDILNDALIDKNFVLVRKEGSFSLYAADEKIPAAQLPRVTEETLKDRGSKEIVQVVFSPTTIVAEDLAPEIKKMMGAFGEVAVISAANQLIMQDQAGNLRRIIDTIRQIESSDKGQAETFSHKCVFMQARDAERILREQLGDPKELIARATAAAIGQQQGGRDRDRDPRQPLPPVVLPKIRVHSISVDDRLNTVFVSGPADKIAMARDLIKRFDVSQDGQKPVLTGPNILKTYPTAPGTADAVSATLSKIYDKNPSVSIRSVGTSSVMVWGGPELQFEIARHITGTTEVKAAQTKLLAVNGGDPVALARTLAGMFPDMKLGGPYIEAQPDRNGIVVRGSVEQIGDLELALKVISEGGGAIGSGNVRIINLDRGSASTLAETLEKMMGQMRKNPIRVINPTRSDPAPAPMIPIPPKAERNSRLSEPPATMKPTSDETVRIPLAGDVERISAQLPPEPRKLDPAPKSDPSKAAVNITVVGNRLIVTSEDPEALALVSELSRLLTTSPGEGDFQIIPLKNATASDAARILDEWFNGPRQQNPLQGVANALGGAGGRGGFGGGGGNPFGGFGGGGGNPLAALLGGGTPVNNAPTSKVRIVADPYSNSLIVRGTPLEILTIRSILEQSVDRAESDSNAVSRTHIIGPFKNASAFEISLVIRDAFKENFSDGGRVTTGGNPFSFFGGQQQSASATARPKGTTLALGVDDRTNSLVLNCSQSLFEEVKKLTDKLEAAAKDSTQLVRVLAIKGIDPQLLQQAIDAIQGRSSSNRNRTGTAGQQGGSQQGGFGSNPFGGFGGQQGGGQGGRGQQGGGGGQQGGGGQGGRGQGGGRGTGTNFLPDIPIVPDIGLGSREDPGFFDSSVTDDPTVTNLLYDPRVDRTSKRSPSRNPGPRTENMVLVQAMQTPKELDLKAPRIPVTAEALEELGILVVRAGNLADLQEVLKIIEEIQKIGKAAEPELRLIELEFQDATSLTNLMNQIFSRIGVASGTNIILPPQQQQRTGNTGGGILPSQGNSQAQANGIVLIPLPRFNKILIGAPKSRMDDIVREIKKFDQPLAEQAKAQFIKLTKAPAAQVASLVQNFYNQRFPGETSSQNQVRITADTSTNTVFIQAGKADLAEIEGLIAQLDTTTSSAINELKIVRLKNALSDELANTLLTAITAGVLPQTVATGQGGQQGAFGGAGANPFGGGLGGFGQQGGGAAAALGGVGGQRTGASGMFNTYKTTSLRFMSSRGGSLESGLLEDVHINSEPRSNSLIISAPPKTMELLLGIVADLDVSAAARAGINVFTLRKADAVLTANLLQQLFLSSATGARTGNAGGAAGGIGGAGAVGGGGIGAALAGAATGNRPLLTLTGMPSDGAVLIDLRISVDDRTNSIVVAGSQNDLDTIAALVARLEDTNTPTRINRVYRLRNTAAADVATTLQAFVTNQLNVLRSSNQLSAFQELTRDVVVQPDPVSNSLLIGATERAFPQLEEIIGQLDIEPRQVFIQVMIAEVQLSNTQEFGVEIGLQSPILFSRSVIPSTANGPTFSNATGSLIPPGVAVNSTATAFAQPGTNFNTIAGLPGNNINGSGIVGFQGLGNLGVGRANASGVGGFVFSAASDTFNLLIRTLQTQGRVDVINRSVIQAADNQIGYIQSGQSYPYVTGANINQFGTVTPIIDYRDLGVTLQVTPRISPEGTVLMRVEPTISSPQTTLIPLGNNLFATAFNVQQVRTTVLASDGETVVLGGLISRNDNRAENKIPWLGDLPWVGSLFRYRTQSLFKRELIVIMTPHIIRTKADRERFVLEETKKMDWGLPIVNRIHGYGSDLFQANSPDVPAGHKHKFHGHPEIQFDPANLPAMPGPVSNGHPTDPLLGGALAPGIEIGPIGKMPARPMPNARLPVPAIPAPSGFGGGTSTVPVVPRIGSTLPVEVGGIKLAGLEEKAEGE